MIVGVSCSDFSGAVNQSLSSFIYQRKSRVELAAFVLFRGRILHVVYWPFGSRLVSQDLSKLLFQTISFTHDEVGCIVAMATTLR